MINMHKCINLLVLCIVACQVHPVLVKPLVAELVIRLTVFMQQMKDVHMYGPFFFIFG